MTTVTTPCFRPPIARLGAVKPIEFCNEYFEGSVLFKMRAEPMVPEYKPYFSATNVCVCMLVCLCV